jgi:WD40 repeat protein
VHSGAPFGKEFIGHLDTVKSLAFSPDGEIVATGSSDFTLRLWHTSTQKMIEDH